jgi:hypothetical protein
MKRFALYFLLVCLAHYTFAQVKTSPIVAPDAGSGAGQGTFPQAINMPGEIAGFYVDANNISHGFLRSPSGIVTGFDITDSSSTVFSDMNFHAIPVGWYVPTPGTNAAKQGAVIGFLYNREYIRGAKTSTTQTYPLATNRGNLAAGYWLDPASKTNPNPQCFTNSGGITFSIPNQGAGCWARGINDDNAVTGTYLDAQGTTHGFLRDRFSNITTFDPDGSVFTFANAINNNSQIAGYYVDAQNAPHAFIRNADGTFTTFDVSGAVSLAAPLGFKSVAINDAGQTAGVATMTDGSFVGWNRSAAGTIMTIKTCGNTGIASVSPLGKLAGYCGASTQLPSVQGWTF